MAFQEVKPKEQQHTASPGMPKDGMALPHLHLGVIMFTIPSSLHLAQQVARASAGIPKCGLAAPHLHLRFLISTIPSSLQLAQQDGRASCRNPKQGWSTRPHTQVPHRPAIARMFGFLYGRLVWAKKLSGVLRLPWSHSPQTKTTRQEQQPACSPASYNQHHKKPPIHSLEGWQNKTMRIPSRPPRCPPTPPSASPAKGRRPCAEHGSSGAWQRGRDCAHGLRMTWHCPGA